MKVALSLSLALFASMGPNARAEDPSFQKLRELRPGMRREEVLRIEDQLIDLAFADAEAEKSEAVLDNDLNLVASAVSGTGIDASTGQTLHRIISKVDGEHWTQIETHRFGLIKSIFRSQGLATDQQGHYWYSSMKTLLRTHSKWGMEDLLELFPLPSALTDLNDNHIGDIDFADGKIYAPAEDGPGYEHPFVVVYDAWDFTVQKYFPLPREQQIDGVPWVAVDAASGRLFSAQYSNTTQINVYDLSTLAPMGQIAMSRTVNAIQGAKILDGNLYMTADGDNPKVHAVYKMNLSTGTVIQVATLPDNLVEVEGLAVTQTPQGAQLDVLSVVPLGNLALSRKLHLRRTELCGFRIDQESRRDRFRRDILIGK